MIWSGETWTIAVTVLSPKITGPILKTEHVISLIYKSQTDLSLSRNLASAHSSWEVWQKQGVPLYILKSWQNAGPGAWGAPSSCLVFLRLGPLLNSSLTVSLNSQTAEWDQTELLSEDGLLLWKRAAAAELLRQYSAEICLIPNQLIFTSNYQKTSSENQFRKPVQKTSSTICFQQEPAAGYWTSDSFTAESFWFIWESEGFEGMTCDKGQKCHCAVCVSHCRNTWGHLVVLSAIKGRDILKVRRALTQINTSVLENKLEFCHFSSFLWCI